MIILGFFYLEGQNFIFIRIGIYNLYNTFLLFVGFQLVLLFMGFCRYRFNNMNFSRGREREEIKIENVVFLELKGVQMFGEQEKKLVKWSWEMKLERLLRSRL